MTRLLLRFWNVVATFRIWWSGPRNPRLKCVSSHFLTLAIELHLARFGLGASCTFELHLLITVHTFAVVIISLHIRKYAILLATLTQRWLLCGKDSETTRLKEQGTLLLARRYYVCNIDQRKDWKKYAKCGPFQCNTGTMQLPEKEINQQCITRRSERRRPVPYIVEKNWMITRLTSVETCVTLFHVIIVSCVFVVYCQESGNLRNR